ncbi:hypothetical protein QJS04_geneDACA005813 [Acorus gramineus]|uniref:Uncharacterized protein n=1 Tax=Acorus gramineus TaxID=55184 RepID=A0AAV9B600_ACOGR|nr:hypothetical protein QJS04_geneDACA005813 [Acorus gramineus]
MGLELTLVDEIHRSFIRALAGLNPATVASESVFEPSSDGDSVSSLSPAPGKRKGRHCEGRGGTRRSSSSSAATAAYSDPPQPSFIEDDSLSGLTNVKGSPSDYLALPDLTTFELCELETTSLWSDLWDGDTVINFNQEKTFQGDEIQSILNT